MFLLNWKTTEEKYTKSVPATMKMTVKGGAAIDPDSGNTLGAPNHFQECLQLLLKSMT